MKNSKRNEQWRRPRRFVLAVLALVVAIVVASQLVRSDETAADRQRPTPTAAGIVGTPAPSPTADQRLAPPLPLPTPMTVPTPTVDAAIAEPSPTGPVLRTAPQGNNFSQAVLAANHHVVAETDGVWMRKHEQNSWTFLARPSELGTLRCVSVLGDKVAFTARSNDYTRQHLAVLDVVERTWVVSRLPRLDADGQLRQRPDFCKGVAVEGQWVFAAAYLDKIIFAVSPDEGATVEQRSIAFPEGWPDRSAIGTNVNLLAGEQSFLAELCVFYEMESRCGTNAILFNNSAVTSTSKTHIDWRETASLVTPSPRYGGVFLDGLTGAVADGYAFDVMSIGGQLWRSELAVVTMRTSNAIEDYDAGIWSAGPIGQPTVPLPRGFKPRLFAYGDGVVAQVSLLPEGLGVVDTTGRAAEWWRLHDGADEWRLMPHSPVIQWRDLDDDASATLFSSGAGAVFVVPQEPTPTPTTPWDNTNGRFGGELQAIGDSLVGIYLNEIWESPDRGRTWTSRSLGDDGAHYYGGAYFFGQSCSSTTGDSWAATIGTPKSNRAQRIVVVDADDGGARFLTLPVSQARPATGTYFSPCRPLKIGDSWFVAEASLEQGVLTITSLSESQGLISTHQIALSSDWIDRIPRIHSWGSADLFQDGDNLQVQLCATESNGIRCNTAFVEIDRSVLDSTGTLIDPESADYVDLISLRTGATAERPERLFQVGAETWRSVGVQEAGQFDVREQGSFPYFDWTAGPLDGPQAALPVRDHRLIEHNGRVLACGWSPDNYEARLVNAERELVCWFFDQDQWRPMLGTVAVDWATVPADTNVTFSHRTDEGRYMVIASS